MNLAGLAHWVKTSLGKYNDFSGRARRAEYCLYWLLYACLVVLADATKDVGLGTTLILIFIMLVGLVPMCAVSVRRLHDIGLSGWWVMLHLLGIGSILALLLFLWSGKHGSNKYGPDPRDEPVPNDEQVCDS